MQSALTKPYAHFLRPSGASLSIDDGPALYQQLSDTIRGGPSSVSGSDRQAFEQIQSLLAAVCGLSFKDPEAYLSARSILAKLPKAAAKAKETLEAVLNPFVRPASPAERGDAASALAAELRTAQPNDVSRALSAGAASKATHTRKVELGRDPLLTAFSAEDIAATWQRLAKVAPGSLAREAVQALAGTTTQSKLLVLDWLSHRHPELPVEALASSKELSRLVVKDFEAERVRSPLYERGLRERTEAQTDPARRGFFLPPPKPGSFDEQREKFSSFTTTIEMGICRLLPSKVVPEALLSRAIETSAKDITQLLAASRKEALRPLDLQFLWNAINDRAAQVKLLGGTKAIKDLGLERELERDVEQLPVRERASVLGHLARRQRDSIQGSFGLDLWALCIEAERAKLDRELAGAGTALEKARLASGWLRDTSGVDLETSQAMDALRSQLVRSIQAESVGGSSKDEIINRWRALQLLGGLHGSDLEKDLYAIAEKQPGLVPNVALDAYLTLDGPATHILIHSALELKPSARPSIDPAALSAKDVKGALDRLISEGEDRASSVQDRVRQILSGLPEERRTELGALQQIHAKAGEARRGRVKQRDIEDSLTALHPDGFPQVLRAGAERLADAINLAMRQIWPTIRPDQELLAAVPADVRDGQDYFRNGSGRTVSELTAAVDGSPSAVRGLTVDVLASMPEYFEISRRFLAETGATHRTFRAGSRDLSVDSSSSGSLKIGFRGYQRTVDVAGPVRDVIAVENPSPYRGEPRGHALVVVTDREILRIDLDGQYSGLGSMPPWKAESMAKLPPGATVTSFSKDLSALELSTGARLLLPGKVEPLFPPDTGTSKEERAVMERPWAPPAAPQLDKGVFRGGMATGTRTRQVIDRPVPATIQLFPGGESFYRPTGWAPWFSPEVRPGFEGNRLVLWDVAKAERQVAVDLKALAEQEKLDWKTPTKLGAFVPFDLGYGNMALLFQADDALYSLRLGSSPQLSKLLSSSTPIEGWTVRQALKGPNYLDIELRHPGQAKGERVQVLNFELKPKFQIPKWQAAQPEPGDIHVAPPKGEEGLSKADALTLPLPERLEHFQAHFHGLGAVKGGFLFETGGATYLAKSDGALSQLPIEGQITQVVDGRYVHSSYSQNGGGLLDRVDITKIHDLETGKSYQASQYVDSNGMGDSIAGPVAWQQEPPPAALGPAQELVVPSGWRADLVAGLSDSGKSSLAGLIDGAAQA